MSSTHSNNTVRNEYQQTLEQVMHRREQVSNLSRVLVVGTPGFLEHVREMLAAMGCAAQVDHAEDFVAGLAVAGNNPPNVVVGSGAVVETLGKTGAAGFKKLSPFCRLVLIAQPTDKQVSAARRAVDGGFDMFLTQPIRAIELLDAMCPLDDMTMRRTVQSAIDDAEMPLDEMLNAPATNEESQTNKTGLQEDIEAADQNKDTQEPEPQEKAALNERTSVLELTHTDDLPADADLGDIDLVEHLLHNQAGIVDMAMSILRASSSLEKARWFAEEAEVPGNMDSTEVRFHSQPFGYLAHPQMADKEALESWAQWLARWLALEYKIQQLNQTAMTDHMTGAWNRRFFDQFLAQIVGRAAAERFRVTVMIFDIDNFKHYNDTYGHDAGDEILRETVRLMEAVVRDHDVVARIGGDEFGVIFWDAEQPRQPNSQHPTDVRRAAHRFQQAVYDHKFPKLTKEAPGTLTISGGLATFPWDAATPEDLVHKADQMALQSKRQGKNALTFGPGMKQID